MRNFKFFGNEELLTEKSFKLGVVGSRSIIQYTKSNLDSLFEEIKYHNFCIISGGMYGVDLYAHNLALYFNLKTIFVLPQGIKSYQNSSLYNQIKFKPNSNFLFVSEYEDSFLPRKYTFLERNRVVSELSDVLLVAQASLKSGSISTANNSFKLKKPIISIPFGLDQPQFQGTNLLISMGANIYTSPKSVLDSFSIFPDNISESIKNELRLQSLNFLELSSLIPTSSDQLQNNLLKLILEGEIFFREGRYFI